MRRSSRYPWLCGLATRPGQSVPEEFREPDGQRSSELVERFQRIEAFQGYDIWVLSQTNGQRQTRPFVDTPFSEAYPAFSPDGRWLAYASDESGRREVYVQPYPGPGERVQLSTNGGRSPAWSADGRELFYLGREAAGGSLQMMVVEVATGSSLGASPPTVLFAAPYLTALVARNYDVTPDGRRFVMVREIERAPIPRWCWFRTGTKS